MENQPYPISFLCGLIPRGSGNLLGQGHILLKSGQGIKVISTDPGLRYVKPGRRRMVVAKDGEILAVYGRPRIRLLRTLERGGVITAEVLECSHPMYLKRGL